MPPSMVRYAPPMQLLVHVECHGSGELSLADCIDTSTSDCPGSLLLCPGGHSLPSACSCCALLLVQRILNTLLKAAAWAACASLESLWALGQQGSSTWCILSHLWGSAATAWLGHHDCAALCPGVSAILTLPAGDCAHQRDRAGQP